MVALVVAAVVAAAVVVAGPEATNYCTEPSVAIEQNIHPFSSHKQRKRGVFIVYDYWG